MSHRDRSVIELGSKLAAQLDRPDDLLASWMAHYIAELIANVEQQTTSEARAIAQETCAKAILELWQHRAALPNKVRPYAKLEPVLRTLASLDSEPTKWRYPGRDKFDALAEADEETKKWLAFANDIDAAARSLIRIAIRSAVEGHASTIGPWVELARSAELLENVEYDVIKFVLDAEEHGDDAEKRKARLRLCMARIESFLKDGADFVEELRTYDLDRVDGDQIDLESDEEAPQ